MTPTTLVAPAGYRPAAALSAKGVWTTKTPMVNQRDNAANVVLNEQIYVLGGAPAGTSVLASMERYTPLTDSWTTMAAMPQPRYGLAAAAVNGYIYAVGGTSAVDGSGAILPISVFDPVTNSWSSTVPITPATTQAGTAGQPLAALPTGRWGLRTVTVDGLIYAVGGALRNAPAPTGVNNYFGTVEAYDPVANKWTARSPMPTARQGMTVAVVNGLLYAIGGWGGWPELKNVEVYDPSSNTWSTTVPANSYTNTLKTAGSPFASMPTARDDFGFAVINGTILNISGDINTYNDYTRTSCCTNVVEAFDPLYNSWSVKAPAPTIRDDFDASTVDGVIYAIAGSRDGTFTTNPTPPTPTSPPAVPYTQAFFLANEGGYSLTTVEALSLSSQPSPTGLQATAASGKVTLTWTPVPGATSYNLYWSNKAGVATTANSTQVTQATSPQVVTGLSAGTWFYAVVTAVTAAGESLPGSEVAVKL